MALSDGRVLEVAAPSRLHFGLLSFAAPRSRHFGGAGVMIERPGLRLRISASSRLEAVGAAAERVLEFGRRLSAYHHLGGEPACRIEVLEMPRQHVGLAVGPALGMAVATGLAAWLDLPAMSADQLAASVGRGRRSAVGVHGHLHGGFIAEGGKPAGEELSSLVELTRGTIGIVPHTGKPAGEELSPLVAPLWGAIPIVPHGLSPLMARVALPEAWRFVLIILPGQGLSGVSEEEAFGRLPAMRDETSAALREELMDRLVPAAERGDFDRFAESLYRFNRAAGECYGQYQRGPYATPAAAELIAQLRAEGVRGVGQSSWGPTIFALVPHQTAAERLLERLQRGLPPGTETIGTAVCNRGARIEGVSG